MNVHLGMKEWDKVVKINVVKQSVTLLLKMEWGKTSGYKLLTDKGYMHKNIFNHCIKGIYLFQYITWWMSSFSHVFTKSLLYSWL